MLAGWCNYGNMMPSPPLIPLPPLILCNTIPFSSSSREMKLLNAESWLYRTCIILICFILCEEISIRWRRRRGAERSLRETTAHPSMHRGQISTPGCKALTMESGDSHVLYDTRGEGARFEGEWWSPWSPLLSLPLCVNTDLPAVTDTVPFVVATRGCSTVLWLDVSPLCWRRVVVAVCRCCWLVVAS